MKLKKTSLLISSIILLGSFFIIKTISAETEDAINSNKNIYNINDTFDAFDLAKNSNYKSTLPKAPKTESKSYILIDYNSGAILAEKDAHVKTEPASLTKMMTVYVIDKELQSGRLKLDDEVKVSKKAWRMKGSRMFIEVNSEVKVGDLLKGIIIQSGNDASVALAEHIAGTEENFVTLMNNTAKELQMYNTHFNNVTGMPNENHYTTAYDLAILSRAIIKHFPDSYELYSQKEFEYNNINQFNRNKLLWNNSLNADGIKTGYTESAGYCLAASSEVDGMRLITVVLGADSSNQRTTDSASLLSHGYRFYDTVKLYSKEEPIGKKKVWMGAKSKVMVGLANDLYITIPKGNYKNLSASAETNKYITAPLKKSDVVGEITVKYNNNIIAKRPIVVLDNIDKGGLWQRLKDKVKLSFDKFFGVEHKIELKQFS